MDMLKQWIISLIFACAAGTLVSVISPKGSTEKTLRTIVGIFVIAAVCAPLSEMRTENLTFPVLAHEFSDFSESGMDDYVLKAVENEICRKILEITEKKELPSGEITVKAENNDGCIIIHEILIKLQNDGSEAGQKTAELLSKELGIPVTLTE